MVKLTQTWFDVHGAVGDLIGGSWSISSEIFLYLIFIPFAGTVSRTKKPLNAIIALSVIATIILVTIDNFHAPIDNFLSPFLGVNNPRVTAPPADWLTYTAPLPRLFEFFIGAMAAQFILASKQKSMRQNWSQATISVCVIWFIIVGLIAPHIHIGPIAVLQRTFLWSPVIAIAMIAICREESAWSRLLSSRMMIAAGEISYSVYLLQTISFIALVNTFPGMKDNLSVIIRSILMVLLTTALAYGTYHLLERPARQWIRKALSPSLSAQKRRSALSKSQALN